MVMNSTQNVNFKFQKPSLLITQHENENTSITSLIAYLIKLKHYKVVEQYSQINEMTDQETIAAIIFAYDNKDFVNTCIKKHPIDLSNHPRLFSCLIG